MNREPKIIHGYPVKDYFIRMITKDIALQDCILDLLDNCIDGANREIQRLNSNRPVECKYEGFEATINFDKEYFSIKDNCGGISLDYAIDYAFHFGRRPDAPENAGRMIGIYGIGMKRAIFKIGTDIEITTSTFKEAYRVKIDVNAWEKKEDWDFDFDDYRKWKKPGTEIKIENLNEDVLSEFEDPLFVDNLIKIIARDYSFILQKGFKIKVNNSTIRPYNFSLQEGEQFKPAFITYFDNEDEEVRVQIKAGMAKMPPADDTAETPQLPEVAYYGWFVSCNNRIVLAGDKTEKTVWGDEDFPYWHFQYNGFMGIIDFHSSNLNKLPWTTTKRDIELSSPLYRRAVKKMKTFTRRWTDYTNRRKAEPEKAKQLEQNAVAKPIKDLDEQPDMIVPTFQRRRIKMANIAYSVPEKNIKRVKEELGNLGMYNKEVGIKTFDYYWENEIGE